MIATDASPPLTSAAGGLARGRTALAGWQGMVALFILGLAIRAVLAPISGSTGDLSIVTRWADMVTNHPWGAYVVDPPPTFTHFPYLYVLFVQGKISAALWHSLPGSTFIKAVPIAADLVLAWLAGEVAARIFPGPECKTARAIAVALVLLNPAIIFVSAVWGQTDSLTAPLVLGAFLLLASRSASMPRELAAAVLLGAATADKAQFALILPVAAVVTAWVHRETAPTMVAGRLTLLAAAAITTGLLLVAPFGLGIDGAARYFLHTPTYEHTSELAFNLWGAIAFLQPDNGPDAVRVLGVPALYLGAALFAGAYAVVLLRGLRALRAGVPPLAVAVFGSAAATAVGFALLTRMHERYVYLAIPCLATLVGIATLRRWTLLLSIQVLLNVGYAFSFFNPHTALFGTIFGDATDSVQKKVLSLLLLASCLTIGLFGWSWLTGLQAAEVAPEPGSAAG